MDFIDPGRSAGAGMLSSRNNRVGNGSRGNDLCHRFVEIPASKTQIMRDNHSTPLNLQMATNGTLGKT